LKRKPREDGLVFSTGTRPPKETDMRTRIPAPGAGLQTVVLGLERKGRGGKTVTIVEGRGYSGSELADLLKQLKAACGTGGTLKQGTIELQGDQRTCVRAYCTGKKIQVRGM